MKLRGWTVVAESQHETPDAHLEDHSPLRFYKWDATVREAVPGFCGKRETLQQHFTPRLKKQKEFRR